MSGYLVIKENWPGFFVGVENIAGKGGVETKAVIELIIIIYFRMVLIAIECISIVTAYAYASK